MKKKEFVENNRDWTQEKNHLKRSINYIKKPIKILAYMNSRKKKEKQFVRIYERKKYGEIKSF